MWKGRHAAKRQLEERMPCSHVAIATCFHNKIISGELSLAQGPLIELICDNLRLSWNTNAYAFAFSPAGATAAIVVLIALPARKCRRQA